MKSILYLTGLMFCTHSFSQHPAKCDADLTDKRDGKIYKTVQIGDQCWMAENINVGTEVSDLRQNKPGVIEKTCYNNNPENCKIYGGLYTWTEAMQGSVDQQGICPEGWHVPSLNDWHILQSFLGTDTAGTALKAAPSHVPPFDGSNSSGFTALASGAGFRSSFNRQASWALFWSSTPNGNSRAWFAQLDKFWYSAPPKYQNLYLGDYYLKENGFAVRCIKNN